MICRSCLRRVGVVSKRCSELGYISSGRRFVGTGQPSIPASRGRPSGDHEGPPAAISSSAAQPFSSQLNDVAQPIVPAQKQADQPKSSIPGGAVLRGLGFIKNKDPPLAMEDHEYPDWLWGLLDAQKKTKSEGGDPEADIYSKTRRQRRAAAKSARKAALKNPEANVKQIPIVEQTIDLPSGDGTLEGAQEAMQARDELGRAMRSVRRHTIKEANFLKSMR